ncbi:f5/8 type c domain containing protein [Anaeramoeba flamelloides]|uniref:F5/8 type c domain containing protein n=1 Tax=Anaeramoeba flamelloides TaxID=1746091 RepID=A0ABQ8Y3K2_9EUKA|nr:f5/8 type c domain containing protein [Anaeramoeba flamelloides]
MTTIENKQEETNKQQGLTIFDVCLDPELTLESLQRYLQESNEKLDLNTETTKIFNHRKHTGYTPLMALCTNPNVTCEMIELFIQKGAAPDFETSDNYEARNALTEMCSNPNVSVPLLETLFKGGCTLKDIESDQFNYFTEIMELCQNPNITWKTLDFLIEQGAMTNAYFFTEMLNPLTYLCRNEGVTAKILRKFMEENTTDPNHDECGAEIGETALTFLCRNPKVTPEMIRIIIDNGAEPNQSNEFNNKEQPFFVICSNPNATLEHFEMLIDKGLRLNGNAYYEECYNSNFVNAISNHDLKTEFLQLAFEKGAKLNLFDQYGNTPLISFLKRKRKLKKQMSHGQLQNLTRILYNFMLYGCDTNQKNKKGKTAFDYLKSIKILTNKQLSFFTEILNIDPNCLENDYKKLLSSGEFSDYKIKEIPVHKLILEMRTGMKCEEIKEILENSPKQFLKKDILLFFKWVYFDNIFEEQKQSRKHQFFYNFEAKTRKNEMKFQKKWEINRKKERKREKKRRNRNRKKRNILKQIFQELKLKQEFTKKKLRDSLKELYFDESTKDFTILANKEKDQPIKVHRLILFTRCKLFLEMFLSIENKSLQEVCDYTKNSMLTLEILIKWLYIEEINIKEKKILENDEKIIEQLLFSIDYYQINPKCNLKFLLSKDKFELI